MMLKLILLILILSSAAIARPNEASGIVTSVTDGDNFEVSGFGPVHLAGVDCPDTTTSEGVHAKEFALETLMGVQVFLDIDDAYGKNPTGPTECVIYLAKPGGLPDPKRNFNEMVVRAGLGKAVKDVKSEFNLS